MFFTLPRDVSVFIRTFDFCLCVVLLIEWFYVFHISRPKLLFLKQRSNWIDLIASIPFDAILPFVFPQIILLRYLRLLKLIRVFALFNRFFDGLEEFIETSNMDKILGGVFFTVLIFTLILFSYGPSYGLFDDFYFVIVTLSTVGYGDIKPVTFNEKMISIFLIFAGIFIFSTITAAISSYFTDRLLNKNDETIEDAVEEMFDEKIESINGELKAIKNELELSRQENSELKKEILELKELIEKDD